MIKNLFCHWFSGLELNFQNYLPAKTAYESVNLHDRLCLRI